MMFIHYSTTFSSPKLTQKPNKKLKEETKECHVTDYYASSKHVDYLKKWNINQEVLLKK